MFRFTIRRGAPAAAGTAASQVKAKAPTSPNIYKSDYPSILPQLQKETTLCNYMFNRWAAADPAKVALLQAETKQQLTYQQLRAVTERLAEVLYHEYGVRRGDVVCVMLLDNIYYPALTYAILRLGAVVSTSNAITTPDALGAQLEEAKVKVIVSSHMFGQTVTSTTALVKQSAGMDIKSVYLEDVLGLLAKGETAGAIPSSYTAMEEGKPDDTAFIPFSSGTTGAPKGVMLSNKNLTANLLQGKGLLRLDDDVLISVLPFFHIYGFTIVMGCPLDCGATQVVMMKYSVDVYLDCVEQYKVTAGFVAPPIINSLIGRLEHEKRDISSLNFLNCSAAPVSPEYVDRLQKVAPHIRVFQGWGMTEMSPLVAGPPRARQFPPYSAGVLAPDTEMRVVKVSDSQQSGEDKSEGIDVSPGEDGELWVRGPQMMKGYTNPAETAKCMQDGWYRTGDIGRFDESIRGVYITDRLKELIKYKGFQVSPVSLEAEVSKHPWVQDCVVVGVSDPSDISFEVPRALVVLKASVTPSEREGAADDIYRYILHHCPPHKRLHGGVRVVDALMKNAAGKVMRRQIRHAEMEYMKANMK